MTRPFYCRLERNLPRSFPIHALRLWRVVIGKELRVRPTRANSYWTFFPRYREFTRKKHVPVRLWPNCDRQRTAALWRLDFCLLDQFERIVHLNEKQTVVSGEFLDGSVPEGAVCGFRL